MEANNKAMREALNMAFNALLGWQLGQTTRKEHSAALSAIRAALALPRRQCDVGTAEEQTARYDKFCNTNRTVEKCCTDCPALGTADCELLWAQIPYNESEATDGK